MDQVKKFKDTLLYRLSFRAGYEANRLYAPLQDNPHKDRYHRAAWEDGWNAAQDKYGDGVSVGQDE